MAILREGQMREALLEAAERTLSQIDWQGVRSVRIALDWPFEQCLTVETYLEKLYINEDGKPVVCGSKTYEIL